MKLFKIPTRNPQIYDADKEALQRRVHQLEEVVEKYRTKRIGPYEVNIKISGQTWDGIVSYLKWLAKSGENCGPDGIGLAGGDSNGYGWSVDVKSNMVGGKGETEADEQPSNNRDVEK